MQKGTRLFWSPWEGVELCLGTGDEPAELLGWGQSAARVRGAVLGVSGRHVDDG